VFPVPNLNEVSKFVREEVPTGLNAAYSIPSPLLLAVVTADATAMDLHAKAAASPPSSLLARLMQQEGTVPLARTLGTCNTANASATCNLQALSTELLKLAGHYLGNATSVGVEYGLSVELGAAVVHAAGFGDTAHMLQSLGHAVEASAIGVDGDFVAAALVASMGFTAFTDADAEALSSPASSISATSAQRKAQLAAAPALATQTARFLAKALNTSGSTNSSSSSPFTAVPFMIGKRALEASSLLMSELESFAVATLAKTWNPGAESSIRAVKNAILATGTNSHSSTTACTGSHPTLTPSDSFCSASDLGVAALNSSFAASSLRNIRSSALLLPAGIGSTITGRSSPMPAQVRGVVQALLEQLEHATYSGTSFGSPYLVVGATTGADVKTAIASILSARLNTERPLTNDTVSGSVDTWSDFVGHALDASTSLVLGQPGAQEQLDVLLPNNSSGFTPSALVDHALEVSVLNFTLGSTSRADSAALAASMYGAVLTMSKDALTTALICTTTEFVEGVNTPVTSPCWSTDDAAGGVTGLTALLQAAAIGDANAFIDAAVLLARELLTTTNHGSDASNPKAYARMDAPFAAAVLTLDGVAIANAISTRMDSCLATDCPSGWSGIFSHVVAGASVDSDRAALCTPLPDKVLWLAKQLAELAETNCKWSSCWPRRAELATVGGAEGLWMAPLVNGVLQALLGTGATPTAAQTVGDVMVAVSGQLAYDPMKMMSPPEFPRGVYRPTHQIGVGKHVRGFALLEQFRTMYIAVTRCEISAEKDCTLEFFCVDDTPRADKNWKDGNIGWKANWLIQDDSLPLKTYSKVFKKEVERETLDEASGKMIAQYAWGDNAELPNAMWPRSSLLSGLRPKFWWSMNKNPVVVRIPIKVPMGIEGIAYDWAEVADHLYVVFSGASKQHIDSVESLGLQVDDGYYKMRPPIIENIPFKVQANHIELTHLQFQKIGNIAVPYIKNRIPESCILKFGHECDYCKCMSTVAGCWKPMVSGCKVKGPLHCLEFPKRPARGCRASDQKKIDAKIKKQKDEKADSLKVEKECKKNCERYCRCNKKHTKKSGFGRTTKAEYDKSGCRPERAKCKGGCSGSYLKGKRCTEVGDEEPEDEDCDAACKKKKLDDACDAECERAKKKANALADGEQKSIKCGKGSQWPKCFKCFKSDCSSWQTQEQCTFCETQRKSPNRW
jgi:hypothetical protein